MHDSSAAHRLHHRQLALQVWYRVQALGVVLAACVLGLLASLIVALLLTLFGSTMSWYSIPYLVVGLYYCTTVATLLGIQWAVAVHRRNKGRGEKVLGDAEGEDDWTALEHYLDATQLLWMVIVCSLIGSGIVSSYIPMAWMAITGVVMSVLSHWVLSFGRNGRHGKLLAVVLGSNLLPAVLTLYLCLNLHMAIMPIMGRIGTRDNPELATAVMCGVLAIGCTSFVVSQ